ncbi:MAG: hypothetical protein OEL83_14850 [Desulforhopalus sp.]|nr:hypothetical protein [Desulforhopalus sp.]
MLVLLAVVGVLVLLWLAGLFPDEATPRRFSPIPETELVDLEFTPGFPPTFCDIAAFCFALAGDCAVTLLLFAACLALFAALNASAGVANSDFMLSISAVVDETDCCPL